MFLYSALILIFASKLLSKITSSKTSTVRQENKEKNIKNMMKIFDNFFQEHADKFSFVPKDGISYKIIFKVIVLAENNKHNAYAKIESKITGKRTFLGNFSINDRSKGIDQSIKKMIVKLENNIEDEINKKFQDFLTNKYN